MITRVRRMARLAAAVLLLAPILASCSLLGLGGSSSVSSSDATAITQELMSDVADAVSQAAAGAISPNVKLDQVARSTYNLGYSGSGVSVSGTMNVDTSTGDVTYKVTVTFSQYDGSNVTINSGTVNYDLNGGSSGVSGSYTGDLAITYNGNDYPYTWKLNIQNSNATGTYSIGGKDYTFDGSAPSVSTTGGSTGGSGTGTGTGTSGGGGSGSGSATPGASFYAISDHGDGYVLVYVDGSYVGTLSTYFPSGTPVYGQNGTLTVDLSLGTHSFSAKSQGGNYTWGSSFSLTSSQPQKLMQLN